MDIVSVVKAHPLPIFGGAVILLILVGMRGSSSSGSNTSGISAAVESQRIATAGNVQIAGINAQAATARGAQGVDAYKTQVTENGKQAIARTSMMQGLFTTQVNASTTLAVDNNKNMTSRLIAGLNHQDNQTQMADALQLGQYTTDAGVKVAMEKLATDIKVNNSNNDAKLNALGQTIASHKYDTDVTAANLPALLQHSENAARIAGSNQQSLAQIQGNFAQIIAGLNTQAARTTASANASATDAKTGASWVGTIASIAGLFL